MATMVLSQMPLYTFPKEPLPTKGPKRTSWKGVRSFVLEGSILHNTTTESVHASKDSVLLLACYIRTDSNFDSRFSAKAHMLLSVDAEMTL